MDRSERGCCRGHELKSTGRSSASWRPSQSAQLASRKLLPPKVLDYSVCEHINVFEGKHGVFGNVATKYTTFGKPYRQVRPNSGCLSIFNETVRAEPADAIQALASLQVALCYSYDFAN